VGGRAVLPGVGYSAFCDVAGGAGTDSFTLAVGHKHLHEGVEVAMLDAIFEARPPFNPDVVVTQCAALLKQWGVDHVVGDAYGGIWPATRFAASGIGYSVCGTSKSEIYSYVLPLFMAGRIALLDQPRLVDQFSGLAARGANGARGDRSSKGRP
jgi:hypothetical protein